MFTDDTKQVVGKIYLYHTDESTIRGYSLEFQWAPHYLRPIVEEDIMELTGNDQVIYLKSYEGNDTNFYCIQHINGDTIVGTQSIERELYKQKLRDTGLKYRWP
jgi:hypothetical protein